MFPFVGCYGVIFPYHGFYNNNLFFSEEMTKQAQKRNSTQVRKKSTMTKDNPYQMITMSRPKI